MCNGFITLSHVKEERVSALQDFFDELHNESDRQFAYLNFKNHCELFAGPSKGNIFWFEEVEQLIENNYFKSEVIGFIENKLNETGIFDLEEKDEKTFKMDAAKFLVKYGSKVAEDYLAENK